jgi:hypothetical protein
MGFLAKAAILLYFQGKRRQRRPQAVVRALLAPNTRG